MPNIEIVLTKDTGKTDFVEIHGIFTASKSKKDKVLIMFDICCLLSVTGRSTIASVELNGR